jgi:hypothetical protein
MKQFIVKVSLASFLIFVFLFTNAQKRQWSAEKANEWYQQQGWLIGCDFLPSSAINQLEMWEAKTFDPVTIDRELGWAEGIGFNTLRVFLHDLVWAHDSTGFKKRINEFLTIASRHHIKPLFVFFDDCWNPEPRYGKQPDPKPGVHNSGWMRSPAMHVHNDSTQWNVLERYVKDILSTFKNDPRILCWDLYNEPGNSGYNDSSMPLLKDIFEWAWEVRPSQPLTVGIWYDNKELSDFQLNNSDIISFHNYEKADNLENEIIELKKRGRPLICTEYMARTHGSTFEKNLPVLKKYNVGAINWGFVSGKSNTIFPWGSKEGSPEPTTWFHDIFRKDGTPFDKNEVALIKKLTGKE